MPAFTTADECWICGSGQLVAVHETVFELSIYQEQDPALAEYTGTSVSMRRCRGCGFTQPAALPSLDRYFDRMYDQRWSRDWLAGEFESAAKTSIFRHILATLERKLPPNRRRLLDVGAHVGKFAAMASRRGWTVEAIELNPTAAGYARERTRLPVHQSALPLVLAQRGRFDAITLTDVLEHIPQPVQVLRDAADALTPGGWVAVKVPCGPNQLLKEQVRVALRRAARVSVADNLVHVSHFAPRSLSMALERAGFVDVTVRVGRPERSTGGSTVRRLAANLARTGAFAVVRCLPGGIHSPLAFNLQAFARTLPGPQTR